MAMLAEKRHRGPRWVLNPRQTAWSKDSNKFGQQYLEKMGWKAGQGIGANLQGCTEHVKVSVRSGKKGVGFKGIPEDVLPHQDNYSDLLAQLATNNPPAVTNAHEGKSLELKSRQSRARVHYHKFTRSKDLSTYSQNDLACILGKVTKPTKSSVEDSVQNEANFIYRGNMNEYFKEKSKPSYTNFIAEGGTFKEEEKDRLYVGFGFSQVIKDVPTLYSISENFDSKEELNESVNKSRKKHKTNYQRLDKPNNDFWIGDCTDTVQPLENEQELNGSGKNSNRKRKKKGRDVELPENCFAQSDFRETVCPIVKEEELNQNIKTLKRKRRNIDLSVELLESESVLSLSDNNEIGQPLENNEELSRTSKNSKKKQKKNYQSVEVPENESCLNEEEFNVKIKKSKKKLKKSDECVEVSEIESGLPQRLGTETQPMETEKESSVNFKKSKKKQKNYQSVEVPRSSSCPQTDFSDTVGLQLMEKEKESSVSRSKKKRKENTLLSSNGNDFENMPINDETRKTSNRQPKHKKENKKVKGSEMIIESQNNGTVEFMQKRQKTIKSVTFSDPLLSVLLIPSRDHLQSNTTCFDNYKRENCNGVDLNVKKCYQIPVNQDQCNNLTKVTDKPYVFEIHKTDSQSTCSLKSIAKSNKIVFDGVTYTNGISEYNHCLPRRQKYAYDATKLIPYDIREGVFDKFPGSNIETLGYGEYKPLDF